MQIRRCYHLFAFTGSCTGVLSALTTIASQIEGQKSNNNHTKELLGAEERTS